MRERGPNGRYDSEGKPPDGQGGAGAVSSAVEARTYHTSDVRDHLIELDALRGIAILGVLIGHLIGQWQLNLGPVPIPGTGRNLVEFLPANQLRPQGVPLFYLLSGYLLAWTEGSRARRGSYSLRSYAKRRVLRLVPAYYVALVLVVVLWPTPTSLWDFLSHATFVHGLTPYYGRTMATAFWSLTPEVIFYLMVPLIVLKLTRAWHRVALFAALYALAIPTQLLVLQSIATRRDFTYETFNPFQFFQSFPTAFLYLFIAGVLLRTLVERLNEGPTSSWQPRVALALFVASTSYVVLAPQLGIFRPENYGSTTMQVVSLLVMDLALVGFFASAVLGAPVLRRLLKWRVLSFIGLISYSMFVFHQTVLMLLSRYVLRDPGVAERVGRGAWTTLAAFGAYLFVVFVTVGIVSYVGYRYVESPFLRRKPK